MITKLVNKYRAMSVQTKASIAYMFANIVSKGINVITVPIFTRLMSTYEVGISTTYTSWYTILYAIVTLSLCSGSVNIAMMDYKDRREEYLSACLTLSTISGVCFALFYMLFNSSINQFTTLNAPVMWMLVISLILNPALDFWYARQRYEYKYKSSVVVTLMVSILSAAISVLCVILAKNHASISLGSVKVISQGVVISVIAAVFYIYILKNGGNYFDTSIWKYALRLSVPLIVHTLAKSVLDVSDRLMISTICGLSEAGIYGTVYSLSMISLLVWNAINTAMIPTTFECLEGKKYKELDHILMPVILVFGGVATLVTLFAPEILRILTTDAYYDAVYLIPALCAGVFFTALYNIYGNLLLYKKKTVNIMLATTAAALINVGLNYICIHKYGYIAAAYTTLASFVLLAVCQGAMVRKVYGQAVIKDVKFFCVSLFVAAVCLLCNFTYERNILRLILILIIFGIFIMKRKHIIKIFAKK